MLMLTLVLCLPPTVFGDAPEAGHALPPAEYGHGLTPAESAEGWISLFDGQSTFGWEGAEMRDGRLSGGTTHVEPAEYLLRAEVSTPGQIRAGGKTLDAAAGKFETRIAGPASPIALLPPTAVRTLLIRPLALKPIFNGTDLAGWKPIDRPSVTEATRPRWRVVDGLLHVKGGQGALEYQGERFDDFVLQIDVRINNPGGNGGLFFRNIPGDCLNGYEAQIRNACKNGDPARVDGYSTGAIDDFPLARRLVSRDGEFFTMTIIARGPRLCTWVNGYQLIDWVDKRSIDENPRKGLRLKAGTLQLQAHDADTDIDHRRIHIAPLRPASSPIPVGEKQTGR